MTARDLVQVLADLVGRPVSALPKPAPWDEGAEERMCAVAESWDDETSTARRLGRRRDQ